jgi:hypothetical protein
MPLQKQNISIQLAAGLDTKTDPKQVVPGKLLTLENGVFFSKNRLCKRNGFQQFNNAIVGSNSTISSGQGISSYLDELTLLDGSSLYSYNTSNGKWLSKGSLKSVSTTKTPVVRNTSQQTEQDAAYHSSGLSAYVYEDSSGGARYSIVDTNTNSQIVLDAALHSTGVSPKVICVGDYFVFFYCISASNSLMFKSVSIGSPTVLNAQVLVSTNMTALNTYDVAYIGSSMFVSFSGTTKFYTYKYSNILVLDSTQEETAGAYTCCSLFGDQTISDIIYVCRSTGTNIVSSYLNYAGLTTVRSNVTVSGLAGLTRMTGVVKSGTGNYDIAIEVTNAGVVTNNSILLDIVLHSFTNYTSWSYSTIASSVGLSGKAFKNNNITYFVSTHLSTLQSTYFVMDSSGRVVARINQGQGGGTRARSQVAETSYIVDEQFLIPVLTKDYLEASGGVLYTQTGIDSFIIDFNNPSETFSTSELARTLHIGGGFLSMYDGGAPVEHGFHLFPEDLSVTSPGGSNLYQYVACYEWMDNQGQIHRSAPSPALQYKDNTPIASGHTVTVTIPTLRITAKTDVRRAVYIVLYRTLANGSVWYKVNSKINDTTARSITIVDNVDDAAAQGNNLLYTTGGVIENIGLGPCGSIVQYQNRLFAIDHQNRLQLWYSKQVIQGQPVEFSDLLTLPIDARGGNITAIVPLDDKLIVFKENSIFYVVGQGPTPTGDQNDFNSGYLISTDGGCIDPRSVVITPQGIYYKSRKGMYLLDRSLQVSYIGAEVEAYNSNTVTSAELIPTTTQVRFTLDNRVALVYDYYFQQWGVFTNINSVSSCIFQNLHTYCQADGRVRQENPGVYSDAGQAIKLRIVTSWLSFAQLQGFQRIYKLMILGEYAGTHTLKVGVAYDFNPSQVQEVKIIPANIVSPNTYGSTSPYGADLVYGGNFPLYQWRVFMSRQKCQAVQFSLEDIQTSANEGLSLSVLSLEVGGKKGLNKVAAVRSFG